MTATLQSGSHRVAITLLDYQFGDRSRASAGVGDASWLDVKVEADDGATSWQRVDACFSDLELYELVDFLRVSGAGDPLQERFEGIEPSLQFVARSDPKGLRLDVLFNQELHPDGRHYYDEADPKVLTFNLSPSDVGHFANELATDLRVFPDPRDL